MKQFTNIVFSCLVFLITLFLFKAILIALGTALGFFLLSLLFEYLIQIPEFLIFVDHVINLFIATISALIVYVLVYLPLEFQITEVWMITPKIPPIINTFFIVFLVIIFTLINFQKLSKSKLFKGVLIFFVLYSWFVYKEYRGKKLSKENLPKIYSVDWEWGIQARIIKIKGVNFMFEGKHGKAFLDNEELLVKLWKEDLITAEQQVPKRFGQVELYLVRSDGLVSNKVPFEIKDPGELGD